MNQLVADIAPTTEQLAAFKRKLDLYQIVEARERYEDSLSAFMEGSWSSIDSSPFKSCWAVDAICDHLEAVTLGQIKRLIINIPPRCTKTTLCSIMFNAWTWCRSEISYLSGPQVSFLCSSYGHTLSLDSSNKARRLIESPWFQTHWPGKIEFSADQNTKGHFTNTAGGARIATSVGGSLIGLGGSIIILDDLNNTEKEGGESEADREAVRAHLNEIRSTRLNDAKLSAVINVQQRMHQLDATGLLLDSDEDWVHLMIPMRFDEQRRSVTVKLPQYATEMPWQDDRAEGELMWPERFGEIEVDRIEKALGPYMSAGRLQQLPAPKGGGIIHYDWWQLWDEDQAKLYGLDWSAGRREFPPFELVIGSLDTSYGEKQENDYNALTVWGIFLDRAKNRRAMLMYAWQKRLPLHGKVISANAGEAKINFQQRQQAEWGLVEWTADTCRRYKVKRLLIEDKTRGRDVANEINRVYMRENWGVQLINPVTDKVSRTHSVVTLFTDNMIYAPNTKWAEMVMRQSEAFPKGQFDDLHDSVTQFLNWARESGLLIRSDEMSAAMDEQATYRTPSSSVATMYGI